MPKFSPGHRVTREIDIYDPTKGIKTGTVIKRYSKPLKHYGDDLTLGPYPELYKVRWDDGKISKGYLPHGLDPVTN